jgi:hypothetical protein
MGYLILIIIFIVVGSLIEKRTFRWETVVRYLWKQIYAKADQMASHMKQFNITNTDEISLKGFKSQIELRGKLINSILDYINSLKLEESTDTEQETFGYGRYDLNTILYFAKTNPEVFKKHIKNE